METFRYAWKHWYPPPTPHTKTLKKGGGGYSNTSTPVSSQKQQLQTHRISTWGVWWTTKTKCDFDENIWMFRSITVISSRGIPGCRGAQFGNQWFRYFNVSRLHLNVEERRNKAQPALHSQDSYGVDFSQLNNTENRITVFGLGVRDKCDSSVYLYLENRLENEYPVSGLPESDL